MNANEILQLLEQYESEEESPTVNVVIQPPNERPDAVSDEDSDSSDMDAEKDLNHLPRRILGADAELDNEDNEDDPDSEPPYPTASQPTAVLSQKKNRPNKKSTEKRKWSKSSNKVGSKIGSFSQASNNSIESLKKHAVLHWML